MHIILAFVVAITIIGIIYLLWCHMFQAIEETAPVAEEA
jgi:hypothetical protein